MADNSATGTASANALAAAEVIRDGFVLYNEKFRAITQRARYRFEKHEWRESHNDAVERIELYERSIQACLQGLRNTLGDSLLDESLWRQIKKNYQRLIRLFVDAEFFKTFFSSITRRIFDTVGVAPDIEFVAIDSEPISSVRKTPPMRTYRNKGSLKRLFSEMLQDYAFWVPFQDAGRDIGVMLKRLADGWHLDGTTDSIEFIEVLEPVFYRDTRAYVVGRIVTPGGSCPLIIAFKRSAYGIVVDALTVSTQTASVIFSFARSYFHVDLETVSDTVVFLQSIMPDKPLPELFTILGRAKQGKTELYRDLFNHLENSSGLFESAAFDRGMVMIVFTLPTYDVVFKIIRDRFSYPKTSSRDDVLGKYELVFKHDRAGRLIDAQEFRHLRFDRSRFSEELLSELLNEASETVSIDGESLIIEHLYIERQLTPLNVFLRDASPEDAAAAVIDYGQAIRDLAYTNIFPGDLLQKNFGVTAQGKVIFFDYDELCLLPECNFRDLPKADTLEQEMYDGAWFYVADGDIFPEQFTSFLGLGGELLTKFLDEHAEILTGEFWRDIQARLAAGAVIEVVPYRKELASGFAQARESSG